MKSYIKTDIGHRENNEDNYFLDKNNRYFILADGMGGHAAGEKASELAVSIVKEKLKNKVKNEDGLVRLMEDAVVEANKIIYEESLKNIKYRGMGTTLSLLYIFKGKFYFVNIGDSRIYALIEGELEQLSKDDSFVNYLLEIGDITPEEARVHNKRNVLTKALGTNETIEFDVNSLKCNEIDCALLCSDGLSDILTNEQIELVLNEKYDSETKVNTLVDQALILGGQDNITVILIDRR